MPKSTSNKQQRLSAESSRPRRNKRQRVEVQEVKDEEASSSSGNASDYEEQTRQSSSAEDEEADEAASASSQDGEDEEEEEQAAAPKSKGKRRKSDNDLNTRLVKQPKRVAAPKEDPCTEVILPSTMQFLRDLTKHNDRDWFHENDARYRHALENFTKFVDAWVPHVVDADDTVPVLPASDLVMRIYRDMRFSKSQIPYKTFFCCGHSRAGRQPKYAAYYLEIGPNGQSLLGTGFWNPFAENIKKLREDILRPGRAAEWRRVLADPELVKHFGPNLIFGHPDELKNAPKMPGVTKDHPDIDLLKVRSPALRISFTNEEVQDPEFLAIKMAPALKAAAPWVQFLNDIIFPSPASDGESDEADS